MSPPLRLQNTATGKKEIFKSLHSDGKQVSVYSCGPTVYDAPHIGNMRAYVLADTLRRALCYFGYRPKHVINITDVGHLVSDADEGEDKIEAQAVKIKKTVKDIVEKNTQAFLNDLTALNIPTDQYVFPCATDYIPQQIEYIKRIEQKGCTYSTPDGIYFDTALFGRYGELGGVRVKNNQTRIKTRGGKRNEADFALWKFSDTPGIRQQEWQSPWGLGFPGWHIECSTMAMELLGEQIDIHTGGIDHIPIHHNNEIAQSETITGKPFVRYWLHTAFLTVSGEKVSKSVGNTHTIADLTRKGYSPLAFRYLCLLTGYHTPLSFSFEALDAAQSAHQTLQKIVYLRDINGYTVSNTTDQETVRLFDQALADDLQTPKALGVVWKMVKNETIPLTMKQATLRYIDSVLGLTLQSDLTLPERVITKAKERNKMRAEQNWTAADALRQDIENDGFFITDEKNTSSLYPKSNPETMSYQTI